MKNKEYLSIRCDEDGDIIYELLSKEELKDNLKEQLEDYKDEPNDPAQNYGYKTRKDIEQQFKDDICVDYLSPGTYIFKLDGLVEIEAIEKITNLRIKENN